MTNLVGFSIAALATLTSSQAGMARYSVILQIPKHAAHAHHRHPSTPKGKLSYEQLRYPLAATIWGEARNQPEYGRRAVGHVIMNRIAADKNRYGHGLRGVVWKRKQFSCWNQGDSNRAAFLHMLTLPADHPERVAWEQIKTLAARIHSGQDPDNTRGATFYHTTNMVAYWRNDMTVVGVMYDHIFYRPKTTEERRLYERDQKANRQLAKARRIARKAMHARKPLHTMKVHIKHHAR